MDLINKVQQNYAKTDLSIAAPLSDTAQILKGDVTIQDLMRVYVFENFLYGIKMNKDKTLNIPDYNLDQLYGATYTVDLTQPAGQRIKNLTFKGKLVQESDVFTVAVNNYRFNGGGGFMKAAGITQPEVTFDSGKAYGDDGQVRNLMIKYIQEVGTITPTVANNWTFATTAVANQGQSKSAKVIARIGLNVRSSASLSGRILTALPYGTTVEVVSTEGDWYKIIYRGAEAYIFAKYAA